MAGFVIERHGYITASDLIAAVVTDMLANGFDQKFPSEPFDAATTPDIFKVTMEASAAVDPLAATQPWRIQFDVKATETVLAMVATPLQLNDLGEAATEKSTQGQVVDILGAVGGMLDLGTVDPATVTEGFINRSRRVGTGGSSYPMSYRLVITPRGFFLGVWEDAITAESAAHFNWILVQRPVDRTTGAVVTTGKAPVFCVNSVGSQYWQFVVRESDILRPGRRRDAASHTEDSEAIINTKQQVALSEDGKYIVTFPSRLNSSRYRYPHELDIIGITSSDVVSQFSDVPLEVYGEATPRSYKALHANSSNNTGMRLLVLTSGGGIE